MEMDQVSNDGRNTGLEPLLVGLSPCSFPESIVVFEALHLPRHITNYGPGPLASRQAVRVEPSILRSVIIGRREHIICARDFPSSVRGLSCPVFGQITTFCHRSLIPVDAQLARFVSA